MKRFLFFLFILLFGACNAPRAVFDYDQKVDFTSYQTYAIWPELSTGLAELDERRLVSSIKEGLKEKRLSAAEHPDLFLNISSEEYRAPSRNHLGIGIGGGGGNIGVGVSGGIPLGGPEVFLVITFDLIEARSNELVWQAVVETIFNPDAKPAERQDQFNRIAEEALSGYPPK